MKKTLIIVLMLFGAPKLFAQFTQTWNTTDKLNSATAGFFYEKEANLNFRVESFKSNYLINGISNYSTLLKNGKYGFGVNYVGAHLNSTDVKYTNNLLKINLNRQFQLKNGSRLSAGIGLGVGYSQLNYRQFSSGSNFDVLKRKSIIGDLGVAYATKRLKAGVNMTYMYFVGSNNNYNTHGSFGLSAFSSYSFGNEEKLQFTPYIAVNAISLGVAVPNLPSLVYAGTFAYKSKFMLGGGVKYNNRPIGFLTASYVIRNKLKLTYSFDFNLNTKTNYFNGNRHEFGIAYQLGKR